MSLRNKLILGILSLLGIVSLGYFILWPADYIIRFQAPALPGTINQTLKISINQAKSKNQHKSTKIQQSAESDQNQKISKSLRSAYCRVQRMDKFEKNLKTILFQNSTLFCSTTCSTFI